MEWRSVESGKGSATCGAALTSCMGRLLSGCLAPRPDLGREVAPSRGDAGRSLAPAESCRDVAEAPRAVLLAEGLPAIRERRESAGAVHPRERTPRDRLLRE